MYHSLELVSIVLLCAKKYIFIIIYIYHLQTTKLTIYLHFAASSRVLLLNNVKAGNPVSLLRAVRRDNNLAYKHFYKHIETGSG